MDTMPQKSKDSLKEHEMLYDNALKVEEEKKAPEKKQPPTEQTTKPKEPVRPITFLRIAKIKHGLR